jgi:hypothetical protein
MYLISAGKNIIKINRDAAKMPHVAVAALFKGIAP